MHVVTNEPDYHELENWERPADPPETPSGAKQYLWLFPVCEKLLEAEWPEQVLEKSPEGLKSQCKYVELYWERVREFMLLKRYGSERCDVKRRAELLTVALIQRQGSVSYVIQRYEVNRAKRRKLSGVERVR